MTESALNLDDKWLRTEWEQNGERVFGAEVNVPLHSVADSSRSAFESAFLRDIAALRGWRQVPDKLGLLDGALQIAVIRLVLGNAGGVLASDLVTELGSWYVRRLISRLGAVNPEDQPTSHNAADEKMARAFCRFAHLGAHIALGSEVMDLHQGLRVYGSS